MTSETRQHLLSMMDSPAVAAIDQAIMDAWLSTWASREEYEREAVGHASFYAVLATAEYHQHWESIGATHGPEPHSTFTPFPGGGYPGETDAEYRERIGGASTVTETPTATDERFRRVTEISRGDEIRSELDSLHVALDNCVACGGKLHEVRAGVQQCEWPKCRKFGMAVNRG